MTREALILAGGLGTRLRSVVADRPKPLAEVAGRPFIAILLDMLARFGFQRAVLCVGHMGELVPQVLGNAFGSVRLDYSFETTPLGTGGALRNAAHLVNEANVLAMNGDSFCDVDLAAFCKAHHSYGAGATLVALHRDDRRRSGTLALDRSGRIVSFEARPSEEKPGLINAGIYLLRRDMFDLIPPDRKVSLEEEVFPTLVERGELFAWPVEGRFIDIGTPESYDEAQRFF